MTNFENDGYPRAVVALAGARDHYQLPLALHEGELLQRLVTDLYWPVDRKWFASSFGNLIPQHFLSKRFCEGLSSTKVRMCGNALGAFTLMKATPSLALNWHRGKSLSKRARRIALREGAALFCYSTYASEAFKLNGDVLPYRFLFQLHPHPKTVHRILENEMGLVPWGKSSLKMEWELSLPKRQLQELCSETQLANGWVVASTFTARTLVEHGIQLEQIHVVPYGVSHEDFTNRVSPPSTAQPFTAIYVGGLIQRKGLSYFLDAVRMLKSRKLRVVLCGRGIVDRELLSHYSDLELEIKIDLPNCQLVHEAQQSDVVVLPSLAEGFAHVILEMMSCGLPVITTANTCAPDVMVDGEHGFIVPVRDAAAIAEKLEWGIAHRGELASMGEAAASRSRLFTWGRFRTGIREAYKNMVISAQEMKNATNPNRV